MDEMLVIKSAVITFGKIFPYEEIHYGSFDTCPGWFWSLVFSF
jgi:hypothetical protein